jgi:hypothetical protein
MADIRLSIPDTIAEIWRRATGVETTKSVEDSITFYKWCIDETARGRVILSAAPDGTDVVRIDTPAFEIVRKRRQDWLPR